MPAWFFPVLVVFILAANTLHAAPVGSAWQDTITATPYSVLELPLIPVLQVVRQSHEKLQAGKSVIGTPLRIGNRSFQHGLGTHSVSCIRLFSPEPIKDLSAYIGVDNNERTAGGQGSVTFAVIARGREIYRSDVIRGGEAPAKIEVELGGARTLELLVTDAGDGPVCDHADWADATITTIGGQVLQIDEITQGIIRNVTSRYPFSFTYDGKSSDEMAVSWGVLGRSSTSVGGPEQSVLTWTAPDNRLRVTWQVKRFRDFPAVDWVLYFENIGDADTGIIENIQALDIAIDKPMQGNVPYRLHRTHGGTWHADQFEATQEVVDAQKPRTLDAGHGRSSGNDFPFFKIETGEGSLIAAVGWSGYWKANLESQNGVQLRATAGMDPTHFVLHPGEKVRSPRILLMNWSGDTLESNAQFRQLIYKHYSPKIDGKTPLPIPFCNTCFTRGGGWLNECNAENQISLIKAYAKLGVKAIMTDAGWFTGGWPNGAGNWDPRKDAYPDGMGPIAAAAKEVGSTYGLWFEPERVVAGTEVHKKHPEWCLASEKDAQSTYLLNFGLPEVQDYFLDIVKGFMDLPGFSVYRQDFNMDPRPYWLFNDPPDRQGITEMKYVEGLYQYWDKLAAAWPDSLREECASGGHRIDLETVSRLHIAQKTDMWFHDDVDQAALWGVSQYLPNNLIVAHLNNLDDYSFHSTLASSLCLGWMADAPDFDTERGKKLVRRYLDVRDLLVGAWYPLLPYSRDPDKWMASQYHRSDMNKGMILVFRRADSPYQSVQVSLHGLDPNATYELSFDSTGKKIRVDGAALMRDYVLTIPEKHKSDLIVYRKV